MLTLVKTRRILRLFLVAFLLQASNAYAMTDDMCSADEQCVLCRETIQCQRCYYKCANKHGQITGDIHLIYRLSDKEIRALKCYKNCWGEEVDIDIKEDRKPSTASGKSYHKKRH